MPRQSLSEKLAELERRDLRRVRRTIHPPDEPGNAVIANVDGRRLVNFCSNDYLGLSQHREVIDALRASAARSGVGSGASHLVTGHAIEHERLEEELAEFTGRERALLFSTGYMANLAAITALAGRGDLVLLDRLSHASLIDAALLSGARVQRHAHGDAGAAERLLSIRATTANSTAILVTDGVFSMDGDLAPLPELARVAQKSGAWLAVDDAHGLGVLGATGRGTLEHFKLTTDDVPILIGTLGKAFGTFGAFVAGSADLIEYLMQKARSYIYTTALPPCVAAATRAALAVARRDTWRREHLQALIVRFRDASAALEIPVAASATPIQPIPLGTPQAALRASRALEQAGFWVTAIRPPTVPAGSARLRITLSAAHSESQVDGLVEALGRACRAGG
ncbi:MAG: 8-amino-7-oxononanoate synthase [Steroidobacteraceae bacterium]